MLSSPLWRAAFFVYGLVYDGVYERKVRGIWVKLVDVKDLSTILPHFLLKC